MITIAKRRGRWAWVEGCKTFRREAVEGIESSSFDLSTLADRGYLSQKAFLRFREATGLADFSWRMIYNRRSWGKSIDPRGMLRKAQGYVIFMHGWGGSNAIWENLPAMVCRRNSKLVSFTLDVNGFGGSSFIGELPEVSQCDPKASMRAVEQWIEVLKLRRQRGSSKIFTFVGHSMSGASLFYKDDKGWEEDEYALCAMAPALLANDVLRQGFYMTLGVGIGAGLQYEILDKLKDRLASRIIEGLITGASKAVKREHVRIFARTPKGTLAQTFYAIGLAEGIPRKRNRRNFKVILGHKDPLVGLSPMLNLLEELGFSSENIRVILGDHYFFSVSRKTQKTHAEGREISVNEILELHAGCWAKRKKRKRSKE